MIVPTATANVQPGRPSEPISNPGLITAPIRSETSNKEIDRHVKELRQPLCLRLTDELPAT
jgi:hypothetical protein